MYTIGDASGVLTKRLGRSGFILINYNNATWRVNLRSLPTTVRRYWRPHSQITSRMRTHLLHPLSTRPPRPKQWSLHLPRRWVSFSLSNFQSTENERKDSAEKFPKNFALIRLSDKARQAPKPAVHKEPMKKITLHLDAAFDDSTH